MYTHVLVPVAPDHEGCGEIALSAAEQLLDKDGRITILFVQENIPAFVASQIPEEIIKENLAEKKRVLPELSKRGKAHTDVVIAHGQAARTIVDYAESHKTDCIVIASHNPTFADYFIGSTAAWVARHAGQSVLVIR